MDYSHNYEELSDAAIKELRKTDKDAAFGHLYRKYADRMVHYIASIVQNRDDAKDIAHETFIRAYGALDRFKEKGAKMSTWLYTIARNLSFNYIEKRKHHAALSIDESIGAGGKGLLNLLIDSSAKTADEIADDKEVRGRAHAVIQSLPPKYREVVSLCIIQGLPYAEAASILKCSTSLVGIRLKRAKEKLLKLLGID